MARVETPRGRVSPQNQPEEEHLDEWFARRLESQGIPSRFGAPSLSRITAVVALVGLGGMLFLLLPYRATGSSIALAYTAVFLGPYSTVAWLVLRDVWKRAWQPVEVLQSRPGPPPAETAQDDA